MPIRPPKRRPIVASARPLLLWSHSPHRLPAIVVMLALAAGDAAGRDLPVVHYGPDDGLSGHPVTALGQDAADRLWVATLGGGAFRFDGRSWRRFTTRDGLLSDAR